MKRKVFWVPVVLFFLCLFVSHNVRGIPNTFGGFGGFINPAGMRLEDFAAQKKIWNPRAELKGTWELWKDDSVTDTTIELLHLKMSALVFGVPASEVTVQRKDDKILQFQVVFEPYDKIKDFDRLSKMVKTNASLWSGSSATSDTMKRGSAVYSFREEKDDERVVVTIKGMN